MTDEQFEKFVNIVAGRSADHDLLIEIKTIVNTQANSYKDDRDQNSKKIGVLDRAIDAAHKRLDYLFGGVLLTVAGTVIATVTFFITHKT